MVQLQQSIRKLNPKWCCWEAVTMQPSVELKSCLALADTKTEPKVLKSCWMLVRAQVIQGLVWATGFVDLTVNTLQGQSLATVRRDRTVIFGRCHSQFVGHAAESKIQPQTSLGNIDSSIPSLYENMMMKFQVKVHDIHNWSRFLHCACKKGPRREKTSSIHTGSGLVMQKGVCNRTPKRRSSIANQSLDTGLKAPPAFLPSLRLLLLPEIRWSPRSQIKGVD